MNYDLPPNPKLRTLAAAIHHRESLRAAGKRVVLTNGCFDLLHAGHIHCLQQASQIGDALFVAINSDASVRSLKGPHRPVQSELERAFALGALACTETVFVFDQPRLTREIAAIRPDVYVKAGDYTLETLDAGERAELQRCQVDVRFLDFLGGLSSTSVIRRIADTARSPGTTSLS